MKDKFAIAFCLCFLFVMIWLTMCQAATLIPNPSTQQSSAASPSGTPHPTRPANSVSISIVTNDTKAEWLGKVTDAFNAAPLKTSAGHQIVVEMIQESSPDPTVKKIVAGELQATLWSPSDISWVEQANQLLKDKGQPPVVSEACPPIAYIATGFAMWRPMAEALGWPDEPIGWKQITELAGDPQGWAKYGHPEWGQFKFGHSHPEQSSTGFNMLASLAYAAAGKTSELSAQDVYAPAVKDSFRKLELDTFHYGTSTSRLLNLMAARGPGYLHATTSSETAYIYTVEHQGSTLRFPWAFIFPAEGTFWMDNPTCILQAKWVSDEQKEAAKIYRDYLLSPAAQDKAVEIGLRPAVAGIDIHCPICLDRGTDPRVSPQTVPPLANLSGDTAAAIINVFKETKKKATVILVLDRSGSMGGEKLTSAVIATNNFISRLAPEDRLQLFIYNNLVEELGPRGAASDVQVGISEALGQLKANGNTALNDATCAAMQSAEEARKADHAAGEVRLYGIVLLTDGLENMSIQKDINTCLPTGEDVDGVKIFTIAFGKDADAKLLKQIAERTNGKTFTADPATIEQVYLAISAEQ